MVGVSAGLALSWENAVMGQKFRAGDGPDQVMLMPADPREWLPPGHLAWKVMDLAGEMDLSRFGAGYRPDGQGGRRITRR